VDPRAKLLSGKDFRGAPPEPARITSKDNHWLKLFRESLRGADVSQPADGRPIGSSLVDENLSGTWIGIEGPHLVTEAIRSGLTVAAILASETGERYLESTESALALRASEAHGHPLLPAHQPRRTQILRTTDRLFESVAGTKTPQGIAALVTPRSWTFDDLLAEGVALVVVLAGVQDPGNVGTILRSAEAFGATGAIAATGSAFPFAPKVLRASSGSALRLPVVHGADPLTSIKRLASRGLKIYAASSRRAETRVPMLPAAADLRHPAAIVVGNENAGLSAEIEAAADGSILIPLLASVDSLNAAVAASVLLYEAARQRRLETN
jgi:RNA methyltransferase, TrmH family